MEIIGYSERGAMNALFYGIALKKDEDAMRKFLKLAQIDKEYYDFKLYMEFSLSEYGSPDLVIIANKPNKVAFFVEAKASCCDSYNIKQQKSHHDEYIKSGGHSNGHASNLFFQLRLKNYFFQLKDWLIKPNTNQHPDVSVCNDIEERIQKVRGRWRQIGNNPIVNKFVREFGGCKDAYYIAIVPEPEQSEILDNPNRSYGFPIHFISWEKLYNEFKDYGFLNEVIIYNQEKRQNQILNRPINI